MSQQHAMSRTYFMGPQGENMKFLRTSINSILHELEATRQRYFPDDKSTNTDTIHQSQDFQDATKNLAKIINHAVKLLGEQSIPYWSPRYGAHMCSDLTIPAMLGYFMAMCYNPNNIALEVSPFTTHIEYEVGQQFCKLFGYNTNPSKMPMSWGHVTSGGTVANIESLLVLRNMKFYPLALRRAIDAGPLQSLTQEFTIETCTGETKLFSSLSTWELLNLRVETILNIPRSLDERFGITRQALSEALRPYSVQCTGKDVLERHFDIDRTPQVCLGKTGHYSWEKGGAMIGIGSENVVGIDIDERARVDITALNAFLQRCLNTHQAVYGVVAIIGSTEEGSVDRLSEIVDLRRQFQAKGLSFGIHADAAWGGYFATMLPPDICQGDGSISMSNGLDLRPETARALQVLRDVDSITVDPHKAGYIPYPAGCLVYYDERMKHHIAWTSPYLSQGVECGSMGVFGLEGSKPGAAAMSVWLSHTAIGLHYDGYGSILRQASSNSAMMSAFWATLHTDDDCFICVPFDLLPSELLGDPDAVTEERNRIRTEILGGSCDTPCTPNADKPRTQHSVKLLRQLGSELNINCFALNWRHRDGRLNSDTAEANLLMQRVIKSLSVGPERTDSRKLPLYLTSTEFSVERYGECVEKFKGRLHLKQSAESLFVLRNVVMSPFVCEQSIFQSMVEAFRKIVIDEVEKCRKRHDEACKNMPPLGSRL